MDRDIAWNFPHHDWPGCQQCWGPHLVTTETQCWQITIDLVACSSHIDTFIMIFPSWNKHLVHEFFFTVQSVSPNTSSMNLLTLSSPSWSYTHLCFWEGNLLYSKKKSANKINPLWFNSLRTLSSRSNIPVRKHGKVTKGSVVELTR